MSESATREVIGAGTWWYNPDNESLYFLGTVRGKDDDRFAVYGILMNIENGCRWSEPVELGNSDDITDDELNQMFVGAKFIQKKVKITVEPDSPQS